MFPFRTSKAIFFPLLLLLFVVNLPYTALSKSPQEIKIGILAKRGPERTQQKWSATADYLSTALPDYHFTIVPLDFIAIHTAIKEAQIDFVLTNPAFYVEMEKRHGVNRIATLINRCLPEQHTTTFGGVIFVRADRDDIKNINNLRNQSFMAVDELSFGGWIMCWRKLHKLGIDPFSFFSSLSYGHTHDAVVHAVRNGDVDGGTVRTDTLERMTNAGIINLDEFRILGEQQAEHFSFKLSTALYPEWPFSATQTTSPDLARHVASALLAMDKNEPAAVASNSAGWTVAMNYQPVHDCLLELGITPYDSFGQFSSSDVFKRYWLQITLLLFLLTAVITTSFYFHQLSRSLQQKKWEVDELNKTLENKVVKRTEKVNILLDRELYLREIMKTISEVNGLLLSETHLELLLQKACRVMGKHGHYGYSWIGLLENDMVETVFTTNDSVQFPSKPPYKPFDINDPFSSTPSAHCMASNHTIVIEQSDTVSTVSPWLDRAAVTGYRAVIALPLQADKYTPALGALTVYTLRLEGFEQEEIAMLEELAGDIGFAISSFKQKEKLAKLEIERTENYEETIVSFANMIDQRDTYTAGHTARVAHYSKLLSQEMNLSEEDTSVLLKAATLHDIGKIATPDSVLLKPGKLSALDYDLIKLHASAGYDMLSNLTMYKGLAKIIRHHHERYDGMGYPDRLQGKDIPLLSRIITVADAFDAMTTNRIYKPRKAIKEALKELKQLSGSQFDPEVVTAALKVLKNIEGQKSINQLPKNQMEQRRFSYFFSDKLTGVYNEDYLQIILRNNKELYEYKCLYNLHIVNLQQYNTLQGWGQGNILMQKVAYEIQNRFPDTLQFRAYAQYFVIISKEHFDILEETFKLDSLQGTGVGVEIDHLSLKQDTAYYIEKMEKFEIQSEMET